MAYNVADAAANLDAVNTALVEGFKDAGSSALGTWAMLAAEFGAASSPRADFGYIESLATTQVLRQGEDPVFSGARAYNAQYEMEIISRAMSLGRLEVEYDGTGRYAATARQFGAMPDEALENRIWSLIDGNTLTGPDGVALISTAHPHGPSGNQSNSTTSALSHATFRAGLVAMQGYQRENGDYYRSGSTLLFCNQSDQAIALEVTGANKPLTIDSSGAFDQTSNVVGITSIENVYEGICSVIIVPQLASGNWLLVDDTKPMVRPWAIQFGQRPAAIPADPNSDAYKKRNLVELQIKGDLIHGPGHWQSAYGNLSN